MGLKFQRANTFTATHEQHRSNDTFIAAAINEINKVGPFGLNQKKKLFVQDICKLYTKRSAMLSKAHDTESSDV